MKKPTRSDEREEPSADSSKEVEAVLDHLDGLGDQDDDIIDLEDVVEPYSDDGPEDDDDLTSEAVILDVSERLGMRGFEDKDESDDEFLLEDDLLKELAFFRDEEAVGETDQTARSMEQELDPLTPSVPEEAHAEAIVLPAAAHAVDVQEPEAPVQPIAAPAEAVVSLDGFVAQIESKLLETIREIVEARLPGIVRTVLTEEIEKLKTDQGPED